MAQLLGRELLGARRERRARDGQAVETQLAPGGHLSLRALRVTPSAQRSPKSVELWGRSLPEASARRFISHFKFYYLLLLYYYYTILFCIILNVRI